MGQSLRTCYVFVVVFLVLLVAAKVDGRKFQQAQALGTSWDHWSLGLAIEQPSGNVGSQEGEHPWANRLGIWLLQLYSNIEEYHAFTNNMHNRSLLRKGGCSGKRKLLQSSTSSSSSRRSGCG